MTKLSKENINYKTIPILPVSELMILPGMIVPITLKSLRDKELIERAFFHGRIFGIVQPRYESKTLIEKIGVIVKIISFEEAKKDNKDVFIIKIKGLSRFEVMDVNISDDLFLMADIRSDKYQNDITPPPLPKFDRTLFIKQIVNFFESININIDIASIHKMNDYKLVDTFAMSCPFTPNQRQRLLEAVDINDRAFIMMEFFEMDFPNSSISKDDFNIIP